MDCEKKGFVHDFYKVNVNKDTNEIMCHGELLT